MYEINGQTLLLCPESGRWLDRESIGIDGSGRNNYEPNRSFELRWGPMSMEQHAQLCDLYQSVSRTGTADVVLPLLCGDTWTGVHYAAHMDEPTFESYWEQNLLGTRVVFRDIRT